MSKILIVDDEQAIIDLVSVYLKNEGFEIISFQSGEPALAYLKSASADLAILDVMLPDISGFELSSHIRENSHIPIIMLTAKDTDVDKIQGLALGADDYITKPFQPLELVARIKAQLRRSTQYNSLVANQKDILSFKGLVMDRRKHTCFINDQEIALTPIEFEILWLLLENSGSVVSTDELFRQVWQEDYFEKDNNTVMVHIRHIRKKIEKVNHKDSYIQTVWGVGYKIEE